MSTKTRKSPQATDEVESAARRLRLAALDLVQLLGTGRDGQDFDPRAAAALVQLGRYTVEPLAEGFRTARDPAHRCAIALLIAELASGPVVPEALDVLRRAALNDRHPAVRKSAAHALSEMLDKALVAEVGQSERRPIETSVPDEAADQPPVPAGMTPGAARLYRELVASRDAGELVETPCPGEA